MKELIIFEIKGLSFTQVPGPDDKPWFLMSEVCEILDIDNAWDAADQAGLDEDEKRSFVEDPLSGEEVVLIVSEPGLYKLLMCSNKPAAIPFQNWVEEVSIALDRDGFYRDPDRLDALPLMAADIEASESTRH